MQISNLSHQINEDIRDKEVRLVGADGEQLGIFSAKDALRMAEEQELDLVKIAPNAEPPVCRIMNYGKFRFEQIKREKEAKKSQKIADVKEIRLSLAIDVHDFDVKVNHAVKFIKSGDKVKVVVRFKGREMAHPDAGNDLLQRFALACQEVAFIEKPAKLEGRQMIMVLSAKK